MTNIYDLENRVLLPTWRDFNRTVKIGELGHNMTSIDPPTDLSQIKFDWSVNKNIGTAADLVNNLFVANDLYSVELSEAIKYIEENTHDSSSSLLGLIAQIKEEINFTEDGSTKLLETSIQSVDQFHSFFDRAILNKIISKTKNLTKSYLYNAIHWVDLARLYTIRGHDEKANKCIKIALQLAPNNRFVLRSATRFFIHNEDGEQAIHYLKKSNITKNDPWLISAHIASSNFIGRYSPFIKNGLQVVKSGDFSNFDLTELSSSLGTLEMKSGAFKKSLPLLNLSLSNPNDNSLAQYEWLSKEDNRLEFNPSKFSEVKNSFEAFAYENFRRGDFRSSFLNCIDWAIDQPISKRPLQFGSYIGTLIGQNNEAILMCLVGLKSDPYNVIFLNNLIYNYCVTGDLVNAEKYIRLIADKLNFDTVEDSEKVMYQATLGLFYLRSGHFDFGKNMYKTAIENSKKLANQYYYNQAILNFTRELRIVNDSELQNFVQQAQSIKSNDSDILYIKKIVVEDYH